MNYGEFRAIDQVLLLEIGGMMNLAIDLCKPSIDLYVRMRIVSLSNRSPSYSLGLPLLTGVLALAVYSRRSERPKDPSLTRGSLELVYATGMLGTDLVRPSIINTYTSIGLRPSFSKILIKPQRHIVKVVCHLNHVRGVDISFVLSYRGSLT